MCRNLFIVFILLSVSRNTACGTEFHRLVYSGRWAHAKLWLLEHRHEMPPERYYIRHLQVCYFLNEQELCKVYCDSLSATAGFRQSPTSMAAYHLLLSGYYQHHGKGALAVFHAGEAKRFSTASGISFLESMSLVRSAGAHEYLHPGADALSELNTSPRNLPDSLFLYDACIRQTRALILLQRLKYKPGEEALQKQATEWLLSSSKKIEAHYRQHPVLVGNLLYLGNLSEATHPDRAIGYYQQAWHMLNRINGGSQGIMIDLSAALFRGMSDAYEQKYRATSRPEYLNTAVIWAKQLISLDRLRQQYEGFYLYRRNTSLHHAPAEERVARLYLTLYKLTSNPNYLDFASRYVEYFRHRPITQVGLADKTFSVLKQMAEAEDGIHSLDTRPESYLDNLVTRPEHIARILKTGQAAIAYFSYTDQVHDSIIFFVQCIERGQQRNLVLSYHRKQLAGISLRLHHAVETGDTASYSKHARTAYKLLLRPALDALQGPVHHIDIISPAHFRRTLPFEGFLASDKGTGFASFDYVFDRYQVGYFTSFTHFLSRQRDAVHVHAVNIWTPDYSRTQLAEITESAHLAECINRYYPTRTITATDKKNLLTQLLSAEILQVSAHADASFDNPERPHIYTGIPGPDSTLLDIDLENQTTGTQLVIYAACKSNVGIMQSSGIIDGFARATLSAGAGGTICTAYNVQESATTELLELFYEKLAQGYSSCEALHHAKKELKRRYPDPRVWQAYIYSGADIRFAEVQKLPRFIFPLSLLVFAGAMFLLLRSRL